MDKVMELYVRSIARVTAPSKGQGLVEYALIMVLVAVVAIAGLTLLGGNIDKLMSFLATKV